MSSCPEACILVGTTRDPSKLGGAEVRPVALVGQPQAQNLCLAAGARRLKQLLSFALGGLLGNVFLHLLPEAWAYTYSANPGE